MDKQRPHACSKGIWLGNRSGAQYPSDMAARTEIINEYKQ
jgi:hypothetical protein